MNKFWLVAIALWKIAVWWFKRNDEVQKKRKELIDETNKAIDTNDYKSLHRIISRL